MIPHITDAQIAAEVRLLMPQRKSTPFKNMITALSMTPMMNDTSDWLRLAAALKVRSLKTK